MRRRTPPTASHAMWGAPTIVTHGTYDCTTPACSRGEWSGGKHVQRRFRALYSGASLGTRS